MRDVPVFFNGEQIATARRHAPPPSDEAPLGLDLDGVTVTIDATEPIDLTAVDREIAAAILGKRWRPVEERIARAEQLLDGFAQTELARPLTREERIAQRRTRRRLEKARAEQERNRRRAELDRHREQQRRLSAAAVDSLLAEAGKGGAIGAIYCEAAEREQRLQALILRIADAAQASVIDVEHEITTIVSDSGFALGKVEAAERLYERVAATGRLSGGFRRWR